MEISEGLVGSLIGACTALVGTWGTLRYTRKLATDTRAEERRHEHQKELRAAYLDWLHGLEKVGWRLVSLQTITTGKPSMTFEQFEEQFTALALTATRVSLLDNQAGGHKLLEATMGLLRDRMMDLLNPNTPDAIRLGLIRKIVDQLDVASDSVRERFTGVKPLEVTKPR